MKIYRIVYINGESEEVQASESYIRDGVLTIEVHSVSGNVLSRRHWPLSSLRSWQEVPR